MGDIISSLAIDYRVVIAQAFAFIVLLILLRKYFYHPVESIMRQRQEQIADNLSGAESQQQQAESLRLEYERHLANIADEARTRLEQAVKDADAARLRMLETAQTEVQELHERASAQLALEREQLRRELRADMSEIAVLAASKALRSQLTPDLHAAVINNVIHELDHPASPPQVM